MDNKLKIQIKKNRKAKNIRLTVYCDGNVMVSAPAWVALSRIQEFLANKSEWIRSKLQFFKTHPIILRPKTTRRDYLRLKQQALILAKFKAEKFNKFYGFKYNRINIKNQKTRWGSCSKKGNLNFNYRIVHLSENLLNYLVVHELCHLKEMNHKQEFWGLVSKTVPDYVLLRKALQKFYE